MINYSNSSSIFIRLKIVCLITFESGQNNIKLLNTSTFQHFQTDETIVENFTPDLHV
jgi:hypothetical protein